MFRHSSNNIVVSTFAGENCTFGQGSMENGWTYLKAELNKITPVSPIPSPFVALVNRLLDDQIFLIPSFFINPSRYPTIPAIDGAFNVGF